MYHYIVRKIVSNVFVQLSKGNFEFVLAMASGRIEHTFSGNHCLGGTRHSPDSMRLWFQRLHRLFPVLQFEVHSIFSTGWPWDTLCIVEWTDRAKTADGGEYVNSGAHVIRIQWGKLKQLHAYLDTQVLCDTLNRLDVSGISEAGAEQIID